MLPYTLSLPASLTFGHFTSLICTDSLRHLSRLLVRSQLTDWIGWAQVAEETETVLLEALDNVVARKFLGPLPVRQLTVKVGDNERGFAVTTITGQLAISFQ